MKPSLYTLLILVLSLIITLLLFGKIAMHPNDYLFCASDDGIKDYFAFAYHVQHNESTTNLECMNYPYGDHIAFTDGHPGLGLLLRGLGHFIPYLKNHPVGVLNLLLVFSFFISFYLLYRILIHWKVQPWIAVFGAISLGLLTPQITRLEGHVSMGYAHAIPLAIWITQLIFSSRHKWMFSCILCIHLVWMLFTHAYLGIMIIGMCSIMALVMLTQKNEQHTALLTLVSSLIPVFLFLGFISLTDTHTGRKNNPEPLGFFLYNAEPDDVLLPHDGPFKMVLNTVNIEIKQKWEGQAYVGFFGAITVLFLPILLLLQRKKEDRFHLLPLQWGLVLAGTLFVLFAFAFPFKSFPSLVDTFSIFKQFRATGRFTWIFFFAVGIITLLLLQYFTEKVKNKKIAMALVLSVTAFHAAEAWPYVSNTSHRLMQVHNVFDEQQNNVVETIKVKPGDYQCMIAFPFYYGGNESFFRPKDVSTMINSMAISYQTQTPLVNANLARISIEEARKIIGVLAPVNYEKELKNDFANTEKPILLYVHKSDLTQHELNIIERARFISVHDEFLLYSITPDALFYVLSEDQKQKYIDQVQYWNIVDHYAINDTAKFYVHSFDDIPAEQVRFGNGAQHFPKPGTHTIAEIQCFDWDHSFTYHASMWMYNGQDHALNDYLHIDLNFFSDENENLGHLMVFPEHSEVVVDDWSLVEITFQIPSNATRFTLSKTGKKEITNTLYIDELIVRPIHLQIADITGFPNSIVLNNHPVTRYNQETESK